MTSLKENDIILVDDNDIEIMLARANLARSQLRNGLLAFMSGPEFIDHMSQVKAGQQPMPPLVLLDLRMPLMDGFEVLQRIRSEATFSEVPVIMMFSNSDDENDIQKAQQLGAQGYQVKPSSSDGYIAFFNQLAETLEAQAHG